MLPPESAPVVNLVEALGIGLLIGIERQRSAAVAGEGGAAGLRTFGLVSLAGAVSDPKALRAAYEEADALVWPGVNEAYGMVYLEAQAAGTPVICEDWPGPRSVVAPASSIVPRGDVAAFRDAMARVGRESDTGARVRRHVLDHHALDHSADRLAALLDALR